MLATTVSMCTSLRPGDLLEPTRIYVKPVLALMKAVPVGGLAHITGGGITENLPRVIPESMHAEVDTSTWEQGPVFDWLAEEGQHRNRRNASHVQLRHWHDRYRSARCGRNVHWPRSTTTGEAAWIVGQIADGHRAGALSLSPAVE